MAQHINPDEVVVWLSSTKLAITELQLEEHLERQISLQVLTRIQGAYDTTGWVDPLSTPDLVRSIIAMLYAAWYYDRAYGDDDEDQNTYSALLRINAESLLVGIINGTLDLPTDTNPNLGQGQPAFFPTDLSSSQCPTSDFPSDGAPAFMMGYIF